MTDSILVLALALFTSPLKVFANVECITRKSLKSASTDDAKTYITCPSSHSTLVSCGGSTADTSGSLFDGTYIHSTAVPTRCYANNANGGTGVYAYARCCNFKSKDIQCEYESSTYYSGSSDDASVTTHCGTTTYNKMLGCTVHTPWADQDGSFPGTLSVRPDTRTSFDTHNYPAYNLCTAQNGQSGGGVKANIACCSSPSYKLTCITRYGTPGHPISQVACPVGYFMSGCSAWSPWKPNGWYIERNICYARIRSVVNVYATAICCRLETDSPTVDPTSTPTRTPTRSPTRNPSLNPSQSPSKSPSNDPTRTPTLSPTKTPSLNPSQSPTTPPSNNPTESPIEEQPDATQPFGYIYIHSDRTPDGNTSSLVTGLIGALVFVVGCLCTLGLIVLFYLWRKRKVLKGGVNNVEGVSVVSSVPIFTMEGVDTATTETNRMTNDGYDDVKKGLLVLDNKSSDEDDGVLPSEDDSKDDSF